MTGDLSGSGTATLTGLTTTLGGNIASGTEGTLVVASTLTGDIYDNNGNLLVIGDVADSSGDVEGFFVAGE